MKVINGGCTFAEVWRDVVNNDEQYRISMVQLSHKYRTWLMFVADKNGNVVYKSKKEHTNFNKMMKLAEEFLSAGGTEKWK